MSKHTPGPWIYYADLPSQDPDWHIVTTENRLRVLANVHIEPGNKVDEANARLIAAAPQLLAVLEELSESAAYWSEYDVPIGIVDRINDAIATALSGRADGGGGA